MGVRARVAHSMARRPRHPVRVRRGAVQVRGAGGASARTAWWCSRGARSRSCCTGSPRTSRLPRSCTRWTSCVRKRSNGRPSPPTTAAGTRTARSSAIAALLEAIPGSLDVRRLEREDIGFDMRPAHGDLGHRLDPPQMRNALIGRPHQRAARLVSDNRVEGEGRMLVTRCDAAPPTTCLFFGDWSAYRMLTYLSESVSPHGVRPSAPRWTTSWSKPSGPTSSSASPTSRACSTFRPTSGRRVPESWRRASWRPASSPCRSSRPCGAGSAWRSGSTPAGESPSTTRTRSSRARTAGCSSSATPTT